jgi:hypothetical protein
MALVGRDEIVSEIAGQLLRRPLVTITRAGGIGKTAVALAIGHTLASTFRDAAGLEQQDPDGRVLGQPPGDYATGRPGAADDEVVTNSQVGGEIHLVRPNLLLKRHHLG